MNESTATRPEVEGGPAAEGDDRPAARRRRATSATPRATSATRPAKSAKPAQSAKSSVAAKPAKGKAAAAGGSKMTSSAKTAAAASAATAKPERLKLVRDSFTMPKSDVELLAALKQRCLKLGHEAKKSELLRAGLHALTALQDEALVAVASSVPRLKTGRPGQKKGR